MIISCLTVLFSQIIFLYLRTINVQHVAQNRVWPAIFSGTGVGITWLIAVSLGVDSLLDLRNKWPIAVCYLIGGAVGTYWGMSRKTKPVI